jgi:tetratricopeptide (TPR) repeat protein
MGQIYESKKDYAKACQLYNIHLKRRNTSPSAHTHVARCLLREGKKKEAIEHYKKAIYYDKWNDHSKNMLIKLSK